MAEGVVAVADIESSPEYQALLVAAAGKPERSMGDSVIPAEPPVWGDVKKQAQALLTDPPHLAVLVQLVKARTRVDSFVGLQDSLNLTLDQLSSNWEEAYPLADPDDAEDPYYERVNLLRELCDDPAYLKSIYTTSLVSARAIGSFSTRDIDIASGKIPGNEEEQARCQEGLVRGAFTESEPEALLATLSACTELQTVCSSIQALFDERAGSDHGLSLAALQARIAECKDRLLEYGSDALNQGESESDNPEVGGAANAASAGASGTTLADRDSVCAALDRIIIYYMNNEPSSPVPVLVQRARDMVPKSFFDVLQELAPAERENLSGLFAVLTGNPLSYLIKDSYQRFLAGEVVAPLTLTHLAPVPDPVPDSVVDEHVPESSSDEPIDDTASDASEESGSDTVENSGSNTDEDSGSDTSVDATGEISAQVSAAPAAEASSGAAGGVGAVLPPLQSRAAVMEVLNQVEAFFFQNEPSSPIPLIVTEVRKIVPKKFTDLVTELNSVLNPDAGQDE